jgi:hypothetical protein
MKYFRRSSTVQSTKLPAEIEKPAASNKGLMITVLIQTLKQYASIRTAIPQNNHFSSLTILSHTSNKSLS